MIKSKFFEYGEVELEASDKQTRQLSLRICMPCVLMQTITPAMLGAGLIDNNEIRNPIAVWLPKVTEELISPLIVQRIPNITEMIEKGMLGTVESVMEAFQDLGKAFIDPSFLISMLPMGIYVRFRFRGTIIGFAGALEELEKFNIVGIPEFRYACAEVLAKALIEFDHVA